MRGGRDSTKTLENIIDEVFGSVTGIEKIFVVSKTGIKVAGDPSPEGGEETVSAMASIMFSAAETADGEMLDDEIDRLEVHSKRSILLISELDSDLLVVIKSKKSVDQQELYHRIDEASQRIGSEL